MRAKRRLGQHFLRDPVLLNRIVDALDPAAGDTVLEIGPGHGGLTAALVPRAGRVITIERDGELVPELRRAFPDVEVIEGDALDLDWPGLAADPDYLLVGNIPYNITTPLLAKALTPPRPRRMVFLVQREVGERVAAEPGTKAYGALSVGVQAVSRPETVFTVPAGAFQPPPKVDSVVLRITPLERPLVGDAEVPLFRSTVTSLFAARRKQLQRSVRQVVDLSHAEAVALLEDLGLDPTARAESLPPQTLVRLSRALVDRGGGTG